MRRAGWLALGLVVATAPWIVAAVVPRQQRYVLHVLIFTALFAALALSYDLVVGHVGSLSLAHPAFFGVGAYTAAILATAQRWPFAADVPAAALAAALAGGIGALSVHYPSVMCPEEMTVALTVNLLVIVFLGGVGSLRGVIVGAVLFTALPEVLRLAPTWRLVIYGILLLLVVVRSPEGIESLLRRASAPRSAG